MHKSILFSLMLTACMLLSTVVAMADAISEYPYTNGFDTEVSYGIPAGWTKVAGTDYYPSVDTKSNISTRNSSAKAVVFQGYSSNGEQILALPEFSVAAKYLEIEFYYKTKSSSYPATMSVGYVTSLSDKATYVAVASLGYNTDGFKQVKQTFEDAPDGAYLAFYFKGTGSSSKKGAMYLDDVTVTSNEPEGTCAAAGKPEVSEVTAHTAKLTWTAAEGVEDYQYVCVRKGEEVNWEGVIAQKVTSVTLDTLQTRTEYDFYVRSYCGAGEGEQGSAQKVTFQTDYSCFAPTTLGVVEESITSNSAKLTWSASGKGETQWQYTYEVWSDETPDWTSAVVTNQTELTLNNLTPATPYQVWVRSYCSADDQSEAATAYLSTACGKMPLPFTEDFSSDVDCWTMNNCASSGYFTTGVYNDQFRFVYTTNPPQYLITPELVTSTKQVKVTFDYSAYSTNYSETFKVGYSTTTNDVATAFTWSEEVTADKTTASQYSEILPEGVKFIAIQHTSNDKYYFFIDNFSVEEYEAPTCAAPAELTVSEVTASSAVVTWTSEAESFVLQCKEAVDDEWKDTANVTSPFTLSDLAELTTYSVRVKAVCGESLESEWTTTAEFTTNCAVKAFPYENAFAETLALCWENTNTHGSNVWTPTQEGENYYLRYSSSDNGYNHATLATPVVALPAETEVAIMFKWMNTGVENVALQVSVDGGEPYALDTDLGNALAVAGNDWADMRLDISPLAGKTVQFFFTANGGNKGKFVCLDDFQVAEKPCLVPTSLQAVATVGGAELTWQSAWDESAWNLQYKAAAAEEWTAVNNLSENTYTLTGLAEDTEYEVQVQAVCSETKTSDWTESVTFTTLSTPSAIDNAAFQSHATKRVVNGQLLIERNGETFNAQGVSVK